VLFAIAKKAADEELKNRNGSTSRKSDEDTGKKDGHGGPVCSNCGTNGLSEKVVKFSTDKFGRVLCYRCQKQLNGNGGK